MLNELWEVCCFFYIYIYFDCGGGGGVGSDENSCVGRLRQLREVIFQECKQERGAD